MTHRAAALSVSNKSEPITCLFCLNRDLACLHKELWWFSKAVPRTRLGWSSCLTDYRVYFSPLHRHSGHAACGPPEPVLLLLNMPPQLRLVNCRAMTWVHPIPLAGHSHLFFYCSVFLFPTFKKQIWKLHPLFTLLSSSVNILHHVKEAVHCNSWRRSRKSNSWSKCREEMSMVRLVTHSRRNSRTSGLGNIEEGRVERW